MMKVLVLNGSPKKVSDTMTMTNAFLKGLTEKLEALKTAEDSKMLFQQATKPEIKGFDPAEGITDTDGIQEPATLAEAIKLSLSAQSDAN